MNRFREFVGSQKRKKKQKQIYKTRMKDLYAEWKQRKNNKRTNEKIYNNKQDTDSWYTSRAMRRQQSHPSPATDTKSRWRNNSWRIIRTIDSSTRHGIQSQHTHIISTSHRAHTKYTSASWNLVVSCKKLYIKNHPAVRANKQNKKKMDCWYHRPCEILFVLYTFHQQNIMNARIGRSKTAYDFYHIRRFSSNDIGTDFCLVVCTPGAGYIVLGATTM